MGIKGLMKLISDNVPSAVKTQDIKNYFGRAVAIDASMSLYQFLVAVRAGPDASNLANDAGEVTSHLNGMFYRTIRMMSNGVKPVYVFEGVAPVLKRGELDRRRDLREKAAEDLKKAEEAEDQEAANKFRSRLVRVTPEHNADVKRLLRLMGVPVVEATGEAEATCAALARAGKVYAAATEDMDALTFGATRLVRHMTFSDARDEPIVEIELAAVLSGLNLTMTQFIDMCILCGCDYTGTVRGIGPGRALKLITEHGSMEGALAALADARNKAGEAAYEIPENFLHAEAHAVFKDPDVVDVDSVQLQWREPDEEGLIQFMCVEKGFGEERIRSGLKRIHEARGKSSQKRMDSFFTAIPKAAPAPGSAAAAAAAAAAKKRPGAAAAKPAAAKKART